MAAAPPARTAQAQEQSASTTAAAAAEDLGILSAQLASKVEEAAKTLRKMSKAQRNERLASLGVGAKAIKTMLKALDTLAAEPASEQSASSASTSTTPGSNGGKAKTMSRTQKTTATVEKLIFKIRAALLELEAKMHAAEPVDPAQPSGVEEPNGVSISPAYIHGLADERAVVGVAKALEKLRATLDRSSTMAHYLLGCACARLDELCPKNITREAHFATLGLGADFSFSWYCSHTAYYLFLREHPGLLNVRDVTYSDVLTHRYELAEAMAHDEHLRSLVDKPFFGATMLLPPKLSVHMVERVALKPAEQRRLDDTSAAAHGGSFVMSAIAAELEKAASAP